MRFSKLWIVAALLVGVAAWVLFFRSTGPPGLAQRGVDGHGTVQMKDTQPGPNGAVHTVTFIFPDTMQRNHRVTQPVYDMGLWERMKPDQDIKIRFLPENPEVVQIQGAQGIAGPHSAAMSFLGWSLMIAGLLCAWAACKAPRPGAPRRGPVMTRQR